MEEDDDWEDYPEIDPSLSKNSKKEEMLYMPPSLMASSKIERGNMNNIFDMPHSTVAETSLAYQLSQRFIAEKGGDIFFAKITLAISKNKYSLHDIINKIKGYMTNARATMPHDERAIIVFGNYAGTPVFIWITITDHNELHKLDIDITAAPEPLCALKAEILRDFEEGRMATIRWWTVGRHGDDN